MLHFKPLGWQKEVQTSLNNGHLKRHHGVDGLFRYLALRSYYGNKLSFVMMRLCVKFLFLWILWLLQRVSLASL